MNYYLYLKLHTQYNMKKDNSKSLDSLFSYFKNNISKNPHFVCFNDKPNYMIESNMCISFEFKIKTNEYVSIDYFKILISHLYLDSFEGFNFFNKKNELYISEDKIENFNDTIITSCIKDINELNNIKKIEVFGNFPMSINDDIELNLKLLDFNDNELKSDLYWALELKRRYKFYFNANSVDNIKMGMIKKLILGNEKNKITEYFENNILITTEFPDDFEVGEINKIWENSKLSLD